MKKNILTVGASLVAVVLVVVAIGAVKGGQIGAMIEAGESFVPPPIGVSTAEASSDSWESATTAVGSAVAVQAVTVAAEVPGSVRSIRFESGDEVARGDVLVVLDASIERAQLASARAQVTLSEATLERSERLRGAGATAQADLDVARAQRAQAVASASGLRATIGKKTIRAPFAGRLGIREVELGQILQPGEAIATLQRLDPIFVDFNVPERSIAGLSEGQRIRAESDGFPNVAFEGAIETIDPRVDERTRNVRVRARVPNEGERLRPGMFLDVSIVRPERRNVVIVPNTAVLYAPYGDSIYLVEDGESGTLVARQVFVRTGERRGDFVEIEDGVDAGQTVVSTGAFKLQNGVTITVDNGTAPPASEVAPTPENR
ncbi:MAG: efflux RND transporter periplasmic adaptor subunit [Myxococcota bacterium]